MLRADSLINRAYAGQLYNNWGAACQMGVEYLDETFFKHCASKLCPCDTIELFLLKEGRVRRYVRLLVEAIDARKNVKVAVLDQKDIDVLPRSDAPSYDAATNEDLIVGENVKLNVTEVDGIFQIHEGDKLIATGYTDEKEAQMAASGISRIGHRYRVK